MFKLIQLEFKKNRMEKYCINSLITIFCLIALLSLIIVASHCDETALCNNQGEFFIVINSFTNIAYLIFASVVLVKITIDEYKNKTINLMFMYPVSRKKIFAAKLMLTAVFTTCSTILADLILSTVGMYLANSLDVIPGGVTMSALGDNIIIFVINGILISIIAMISFFTGIRKKSTSAAVVTAVILATVACSNSGNQPQQAFFLRMIIAGGVALIVDIIGFIYTFRKIETEDL